MFIKKIISVHCNNFSNYFMFGLFKVNLASTPFLLTDMVVRIWCSKSSVL